MSKEQLKGANVSARLQQRNGKGVAQGMGSEGLAMGPRRCAL